MKKKYDDIKNLFDDVEQSSSEKLAEDVTRQNEMSPTSGSNGDGLEFLEKILGVMRQIENLQERCTDIQKEQKAIQKRLDGYKDMKVGLSPTDKAVLTKLPELIYQQVNQNVGEAADHVKVAITKHTESTLKSVDEACDMRIKKAKKELGADKGIFLSWPNFWAMITLTIYSATIAIFAAVYLCDWSRLWAEVWIPFTFLLSAAVLLGIIVLLNKIEGRLPKY
jgi:hypothetical protein